MITFAQIPASETYTDTLKDQHLLSHKQILQNEAVFQLASMVGFVVIHLIGKSLQQVKKKFSTICGSVIILLLTENWQRF
jgi:hypothetical protein